MTHLFTRNALVFAGIALFVFGVVSIALTFSSPGTYAEAVSIADGARDFDELSDRFAALAEEKGGVYAFEVLKRADIPPGTDVHLLGHVVGDELYKQEGVQGIRLCTHDFRNACSHSMVIGALLEHGEGALPQVDDACRQAPGGRGAYTMCFHGFGHGVLAFNGYDFPKTIALCEKTGTSDYNNRQYIECVGGAVMEILGGGGHDRDLWLEKRDEYLTGKDPRALCEADFITDELRPICYIYLTPHLFESGGGNLGNIQDEDIERAFSYCNEIPKSRPGDRDACFGGVGKDVLVLARERDVRNVDQSTNEELLKVHRWCTLAGSEEGQEACVLDTVRSLFWGGENDRNAAVRFCALTENLTIEEACTNELITAVSYYISDRTYFQEFCSELPERFQQTCREKFSL